MDQIAFDLVLSGVKIFTLSILPLMGRNYGSFQP